MKKRDSESEHQVKWAAMAMGKQPNPRALTKSCVSAEEQPHKEEKLNLARKRENPAHARRVALDWKEVCKRAENIQGA
jgi:hypothetical protein